MSEIATNKELFEKLTATQRRRLITKAKCLICATDIQCTEKEYRVQCVTGFQRWLELDADVNNWKQINAYLKI